MVDIKAILATVGRVGIKAQAKTEVELSRVPSEALAVERALSRDQRQVRAIFSMLELAYEWRVSMNKVELRFSEAALNSTSVNTVATNPTPCECIKVKYQENLGWGLASRT
jgi:hypothetical protein